MFYFPLLFGRCRKNVNPPLTVIMTNLERCGCECRRPSVALPQSWLHALDRIVSYIIMTSSCMTRQIMKIVGLAHNVPANNCNDEVSPYERFPSAAYHLIDLV